MQDRQLLERIADFDYVSFDVFDTAIVRLVAEAVDVFSCVAAAYRSRAGAAPEFDFARARREAERAARSRAWLERGAVEVSLSEIYACLDAPHGWDRAALERLEIELERALCRPHEGVRAAYEHARRLGKQVLFISDMYLPVETIRELLDRAGYAGGAPLFVSSATGGKTKATGELYRHVLDELGIPPHRLLHIGDNYQSDVLQAMRQGIAAHHVERVTRRAFPRTLAAAPSPDHALQRGLVASRLFARGDGRSSDFWYRFGYDVAGILILGFVQWLAGELRRDGVEHLYFLARDGYVLQQAYLRLRAAGIDGPPCSYLHASRRALNLPALTALDEQAMGFLISGRSGLTVRQFLERVGLRASDHARAIADVGFASADATVISGLDYGRLRDLFTQLAPQVVEVAARERPLVLRYLAQEGLDLPRRAGVVDLGWHGSLQASLATLLDHLPSPHTGLQGYYLGTFAKARELRARGLRARGFLCTDGEPASFEELIRSCVELFEFIHVAPHGSTVRYEEGDGGRIVPVLAPNDADAHKLNVAERVQAAALEFIEDYLAAARPFPWLAISREAAVAPAERFLRRPTRREAVHFGDITHADGYGDTFQRWPIARPPTLPQLILDPVRLYRDYQTSFWREGYAVRVMGGSDAMRRLRKSAWRAATVLPRVHEQLSRHVRALLGPRA